MTVGGQKRPREERQNVSSEATRPVERAICFSRLTRDKHVNEKAGIVMSGKL